MAWSAIREGETEDKAQQEAEAEAARIITQAKQEDQEIKRRAEIAAQKETEEILSVANKKAEITEVEAKQKALLFPLRAREEIEKEGRGHQAHGCKQGGREQKELN